MDRLDRCSSDTSYQVVLAVSMTERPRVQTNVRDGRVQESAVMNRPFRVLIADDEKPVAAGLQGQLETLGYDVVAVVNDGHNAIEVCRRQLPDVVLMDIEMPGLDGLSAARQIVLDPGTPVVILTAHGHANLIDQAVEDGVLYYLL